MHNFSWDSYLFAFIPNVTYSFLLNKNENENKYAGPHGILLDVGIKYWKCLHQIYRIGGVMGQF